MERAGYVLVLRSRRSLEVVQRVERVRRRSSVGYEWGQNCPILCSVLVWTSVVHQTNHFEPDKSVF